MAASGGHESLLAAMLARRLAGEPLAWITGSVTFCGLEIRIHPGVYVPRPHTEALALRGADHLPGDGVAIDVCTGSGAVAVTLQRQRPAASVLATDLDERAVSCARANGVHALRGDLVRPVPRALAGCVDVVTAVVPYVPTAELEFLQRDTFTFESPLAYDGGADGARLLRRVIRGSTRVLRGGGVLLLELGGDQAELIAPDLYRAGYTRDRVLRDDDGDVRGVEATLRAAGPRRR
ncbi:MAG TPA: putative protein N(5)-glutamine methyltransferase [Candidatus Dormibacteraeota bacterium]